MKTLLGTCLLYVVGDCVPGKQTDEVRVVY